MVVCYPKHNLCPCYMWYATFIRIFMGHHYELPLCLLECSPTRRLCFFARVTEPMPWGQMARGSGSATIVPPEFHCVWNFESSSDGLGALRDLGVFYFRRVWNCHMTSAWTLTAVRGVDAVRLCGADRTALFWFYTSDKDPAMLSSC